MHEDGSMCLTAADKELETTKGGSRGALEVKVLVQFAGPLQHLRRIVKHS